MPGFRDQDMDGPGRCVLCLSSVPCAALISWLFLLLGLGGVAGGLVFGADKTRDMVAEPAVLWFVEYVVIGLCLSMLVLGSFFLVMCYLLSEPKSRHVFKHRRNACARGVNAAVMFVDLVLIVGWVVLLSLFSIPVITLFVIIFVRDVSDDCITLRPYGIFKKHVCAAEMDIFMETGKKALVSYGVAYAASLLVIVSLIFFLVSLATKYALLKDSRYSTSGDHEKNAVRLSRHSPID